MLYWVRMTKSLDLAMQKASALPKEAQEQIGREVLLRVQSLAHLRERIAEGIEQLDAGEGKELDVSALIARARQNHGEAA